MSWPTPRPKSSSSASKQATLRQEITDLVAARAELTERLAAESKRTEHQRHRAEAAEQQASRATGQVEYLSGELITGREQVEHWQSQVAEQRAELVSLRAELTAARTAMHSDAQGSRPKRHIARSGWPASRPAP